jgi:hypothetical protein
MGVDVSIAAVRKAQRGIASTLRIRPIHRLDSMSEERD